MNRNRLVVEIKRPVGEVFAFAINPKNTQEWIDSIVTEKTNEWPVGLGSEYVNQNKEGEWSEYKVTAFEKDKLFELTAKDGNYHVRYAFSPVDDGSACTLDYYEWVESGELADHSYLKEALQKFKTLLETSN